MRTKELMDIALKAGEILLTSGAEIYRVEDTITRICKSYNVDCESFVLPTGIFISTAGSVHESISLTKRIKERKVDLHRIELVNRFSRSLQKTPVTYDEAIRILHEIEETGRYRYGTRLMAAGISAFVFTMLFRGDIGDGIASMLISMLIYIVKNKISEIGFFQFFEFFVSGMIVGGVSQGAVRMFPDLNIYPIIIGAITILLPGVAITNGVKDALYGDIVSSISRLGEAMFITTAVGAGVGIMLLVGLRWV